MFQKQYKAFTLVELIVVITILSIMATIGFISLGGYGGIARESVRLADMNTISRALGLYYVENSIYPDTASGTTVTYSGSVLWTQGYFTGSVGLELKKIPQIPVDPLTGTPYIYSVTHNKQEFQIAGAGERGGALSATSLVPETQASFSKVIVKGNYNGSILGKQIDNSMYIFGVPSIITTENEVSSVTLNSVYQNRGFVINGFGAIPQTLRLAGQESILIDFPIGTVNQDTPILFSGSIQELTTATGILNFTQKAYDLYVSTPLTQVEQIQTFTEIDPATADDQNIFVSKISEYLSNIATISPVLNNKQRATSIDSVESPSNTLLTTYFGSGSQYTQNWSTNPCDPTEMTVVNVSPGTDTLPTTLSGNTLYKLDAGIYFTTRTIFASHCSAIIGVHNQSIIKKLGTWGSASSSILRNNTNIRNVIYSNIMVDGSGENQSGISISGSLNSTIYNVSSYNNRQHGISITSSPRNTIQNVRSYNNFFGVSSSQSNYTTMNNILSYNNDIGIIVSYSDVSAFNNIFIFNNSGGFSIINGANTNIYNNILSYNNGGTGISFSAPGNNNMYNITCYNNGGNGIVFSSSTGNAYYGLLKLFANITAPISGTGLSVGTGSLFNWTNGTMDTTGNFSQDWAVIPSVSGWDFTIKGKQNLTFSGTIDYTFGTNIPFQNQPIRNIGSPGSPELYGTNNIDYNTTKRIGQW